MDETTTKNIKATCASLARAAGYAVVLWLSSKVHVPPALQGVISDAVAQGVVMVMTTVALAFVCWVKNLAAHNEKVALVAKAIQMPTTVTVDEFFAQVKADTKGPATLNHP